MALSPSDHYKPELRVTQRRSDGNPRTTEELVESLERDITDYRECVEGLGTSLDKEKYRQQLPTLRENIQKKIKTVENDIQTKKDGGASGLIVKRISDRLAQQTEKFKQLVNREENQKMANRYDDQAELGNAYYRADNTFQSQQQHTSSGLEVREREAQQLKGLEQDIHDLHEINQDMNRIVVEQGDDIDQIEQHTEKAAGRVEQATKDTTKIRVYHWRNRKMQIIIGAVVAGVVVGLILLIIIIVSIAVCASPDAC